jgi:hypothetical protein
MHEYGLRKRRIEEKPCDYFTQDVIACDNMQKLIPCHIGLYCIHLEKQAHAFILLVA